VLFVLLTGVTTAFLVLDSYIKTIHATNNPAAFNNWNEKYTSGSAAYALIGEMPDYSAKFNLRTSVRWANLYYLIIIETFLIIRCIQQQLV
jgi:hypothetical protein